MLKKNLIFIFLILLIPLVSAIETSSSHYKTQILISSSESPSSDNYDSRVIVGEPAVKNISSANYKMWVGFIYSPTTTTILSGGTQGSPVTGVCPKDYYRKDGVCAPKPIFIKIISRIKINFLPWFLYGVITALFVNYFYFKKKEEKNEKSNTS